MSNTIIKCPCAKKCGGCDYQGIEYKLQLKKKTEYMRSLLGEFGKVNDVIGMDNPIHYRCKATATYSFLKSGKYISGVYEKGTHRVVAVDNCDITDERANAIAVSIRDLLKSFKIKVYNEDTGYGLLRHVQIRVGKNTGQILVVLVCASPTFPGKNNFVKVLRDLYPEITSIVLNVNDKHTSMVMGERNIILFGRGYIEDELCGLRFRISPGAFYQVNPVQAKVLYDTAVEFAALSEKDTVLDTYCGTGTIGLIAAGNAGSVVGVELNPDAVRDAIANAKANGIKNARFVHGDATKYMENLASDYTSGKDVIKPDCIIMDPPRSGSTQRFIDSVVKLKPSRVVYVSCGPESLARDLKIFSKRGYCVKKIQPIDMFPFTGHVETVCLLSRKAPV
ncbi:MAG: 23S rRNA (uracil(1939)-C(5))-methyltransferase RlmD [Lachnospiraceae bacterium]|nr:23S rRNA (uracil(1939)-C(5))-methyltransferase RlmD [Candidatus Colinaster scatohippi]